jgi:ABC-type sugar transport system permease subunit
MSRGRNLLGALLVLPALAMLIGSVALPAFDTVVASFDEAIRVIGDPEPVYGFGNYEAVFRAGLGGGLLNALKLAAVPLVLVLVVAPVLAIAAQAGGTVVRRLVRVALVLPFAAYAPTAIAVAARWDVRRAADLPSERALFWWSTLGLFTAVAVLGYLAVLRRRDPARSPVPGLLLVGGVGAAAVLAVSLQEFTYTFLGGGPASRRDIYPMRLTYEQAFRLGRYGVAAAGSTVLIVILVLLGLLVTVALVVSRARLAVPPAGPARPAPKGLRIGGTAVAAVVGVTVLVLTVVGLWEWLGDLFDTRSPAYGEPPSSIGVATWVPSLISTLIAMAVTVLAAFGIGWLRPLGRHSEWLLLPFGLFLFVGLGPVSFDHFERMVRWELVDTFFGAVPPTWVVVPALFLLTLLFAGQAARGEAVLAAGRPVRSATLLLPVLPMVGVAFVATWLFRAQDLLWPLLVVQDPGRRTGSVYLLEVAARVTYSRRLNEALPVGVALPAVAFVVLFLVVAAVQVLYLDRVALRTGSDTD